MKSPASLQGKRICRYVRVSKDVQEGERQIFSTDSWAKFNGVYIDESFEDTEGSNSRDMSAKRVQFQRMLKACQNNDFDAIVVDSLDRFGFKNNKELQYYLYMLDQWGVELWSVSQGCISDDDVATVFNTTAAAITSEKEQKEKALRNLEGRMANSRKGNYCGGPPPYGLDIACYGSDGKEKWRVVWVGPHQRVKYNPDGSSEEYNGKNNFPSRDATDILRLSPTIKKERIEAVNKIYQWFADELISYYQIAVRLNKEKVQSIHSSGKIWNRGHVQHLLANPVFIGFPTDNKKGQSRFFEYKDGKVRPVNPDDESRVREEKDYWRPETPVFDPIVPVELWNKVQQKLRQRTGKQAAPNPQRLEEFWLQPFVYCAGCGKKMRATYVGKGSARHTYYSCSTYSVYGSINKTGCQCNSVPKPIVEELINAYLADASAKLAHDLRLENLNTDYEPQFLKEFETKHNIKVSIREDFKIALRTALGTFGDKSGSISEAYRQIDMQSEVEQDVIGKIKKMQNEFEDIYQHSKGLTDDAKLRANQEMNQISQEIKRLRSLLAPQDRADKINREITLMDEKLQKAVFAVKTAAQNRQKTQALERVVEKVVCKFGATNKHRKRKAILTEVEIVPAAFDDNLFRVAINNQSL